MSRRIGILGSGVVGKTLAKGFLAHGYEVMIGSRTPEVFTDWIRDEGQGIRTGTFAECAAFGEVLVLAVRGDVARQVLELAGSSSLEGKIVLDACNPIAGEAPQEGVLPFFTQMNHSLMEDLQREWPGVRFVKCFSCVGAHLMVNPSLPGGRPSMFICGDDAGAREWTRGMLEQFGWNTEDMGGAIAARAIEPLCILWCIPGFRENRWNHAFALLQAN